MGTYFALACEFDGGDGELKLLPRQDSVDKSLTLGVGVLLRRDAHAGMKNTL